MPPINYLGWLALVAGVVYVYELGTRKTKNGAASGNLLLPYYLAAVVWAVRSRKPRYLLYSAPFPVALYAGLEKDNLPLGLAREERV